MSADMSSDDIEREIEAERVALARSLDELQRQVSPDAIVERISAMLRENGGDMAGTAMRQARENPIALALTGAGLAWLMAGPAPSRTGPRRDALPPVGRRLRTEKKPSPDYDHRTYAQATGFRQVPSTESFETRLAQADDDTYDPAIRSEATAAPERRTRSNSPNRSLRDRLMEGTEMMTDAARDRVMAAREAAIDAEQRLEARARDYGMAGKDAFYSQPLMGALVAFGVGALAGALLPRTRTEDRHLGAARDRAVMEAERMYRTEAAKLRAQAEALAEDAVTAAGDALKGRTADDGADDTTDRAFSR